MGKYRFFIAMLILLVSCEYPSQKKSENKKAAKVVYAHSFVYTLNMDLLPVHPLPKGKIKESKVVRIEYDKKNRPTKAAWMYMGKPASAGQPNTKIYSIRYTYAKNKMTAVNYSKKNRPTIDVFGVSKMVTLYDDNHNAIKLSNYGIDGKMHKDEYGNYQYQYEKSPDDSIIYAYTLDTNDQIIPIGEGGYRYSFTIDSKGLVVKNEWFDKNNQRTFNNRAYAISELTYDNLNQLTSINYRDADGNLTLNKTNQVAAVLYRYDEYGNMVDISFYGRYGEPVTNSKYTCARIKFRYEKGEPYQYFAYDTEGNKIN
jgi:YD repeat-containing protein